MEEVERHQVLEEEMQLIQEVLLEDGEWDLVEGEMEVEEEIQVGEEEVVVEEVAVEGEEEVVMEVEGTVELKMKVAVAVHLTVQHGPQYVLNGDTARHKRCLTEIPMQENVEVILIAHQEPLFAVSLVTVKRVAMLRVAVVGEEQGVVEGVEQVVEQEEEEVVVEEEVKQVVAEEVAERGVEKVEETKLVHVALTQIALHQHPTVPSTGSADLRLDMQMAVMVLRRIPMQASVAQILIVLIGHHTAPSLDIVRKQMSLDLEGLDNSMNPMLIYSYSGIIYVFVCNF